MIIEVYMFTILTIHALTTYHLWPITNKCGESIRASSGTESILVQFILDCLAHARNLLYT